MPFNQATGQRDYQKELQLGTLYKLSALGAQFRNIQQSLEVIGGAVDVYGSHFKPSAPPAGMVKNQTAWVGMDKFGVLPNYLYIVQNTGTTTSIVLSGADAEVAT